MILSGMYVFLRSGLAPYPRIVQNFLSCMFHVAIDAVRIVSRLGQTIFNTSLD